MTGQNALTISGARKSAMPSTIEPMKAVLVDEPFSRAGWLFESKYDGVRCICFIRNGKQRLMSRNQKPMDIQYPELENLSKYIKAKEAILDGEVVVLDKSGRVDFQQLQTRFGRTNKREIETLGKSQKIVFYVFDLLYLDGYNLMGAKLVDRKKLLKNILTNHSEIKYSPHILTKGEELFAKAEREHLEGIMAKNMESTYVQKRSSEWLKIKTVQRQEAVICGFTEPTGSREYFGSLHLGLYRGKKLISVGNVGSGFDRALLKDIYTTMRPLRIPHHPFDEEPSIGSRWGTGGPTTWIKPKLVCEVRYSERTSDGKFRHPVFEGLRNDKKPTDCKFEWKHSAAKEVKMAEGRTLKDLVRNSKKKN